MFQYLSRVYCFIEFFVLYFLRNNCHVAKTVSIVLILGFRYSVLVAIHLSAVLGSYPSVNL